MIDSYSSDNTIEIATRFGAKVVSEQGLLRQRMRGISESHGDYILLMDSDQVADKDLIAKCVSELESTSEGDALIIPEIPVTVFNNSIAEAQATYSRLAQTDGRGFRGTALPRFFRAGILRLIRTPRRELGYFDHAWIFVQLLKAGCKVSNIDSTLYHLERNHPSAIPKKFFKYYGRYVLPALTEDWRMIVGKSSPKSSVVASLSTITLKQRTQLAGLFGIKVLFTTLGAIYSIFPTRFSSSQSHAD